MKRILVVAFLLFASASLVMAGDLTIVINGDARPTFQKMMSADELKSGMNLISTVDGRKIWANLKNQGGDALVNWVVTDMAGTPLPSSLVRIQTTGGVQHSEERCLECVEMPNGTRQCHEVPCPIRVPCCSNHHRCCIR
jgi:hypothetical protein